MGRPLRHKGGLLRRSLGSPLQGPRVPLRVLHCLVLFFTLTRFTVSILDTFFSPFLYSLSHQSLHKLFTSLLSDVLSPPEFIGTKTRHISIGQPPSLETCSNLYLKHSVAIVIIMFSFPPLLTWMDSHTVEPSGAQWSPMEPNASGVSGAQWSQVKSSGAK